MRTFLSVVVFSLLVIGLFSGYSTYGIPQIEPAPPPVEEKLDLGAMTMAQFVALGNRVYEGKGTCSLCHNPVGGRAPLIGETVALVEERLADTRYQGSASDVESYLYESLAEPSAYVVAGFGKAGTGDTESPMPNVLTGSIGLSDVEAWAVVAYLQDQFSCGACHKVAGEEGAMGPDLTRIGTLRDKDYLRRAILDPDAEIAEGFEPETMPGDYGEQLYAVELEMLVDYLAGLK